METSLHANVIPMSDHSGEITRADITPTVLPDAFLESDIASGISQFHMPRFDELPQVQLYRDQVISYVENVFSPLSPCFDAPFLTPSMVNNYVKSGLISAPVKKHYGQEQVARLFVICIFKQVISINAVSYLFKIQKMTYNTPVAYDYVATELEHALKTSFSAGQKLYGDTASRVTRESLLVRNAVLAFAAKAHLTTYLKFIGYEDSKKGPASK